MRRTTMVPLLLLVILPLIRPSPAPALDPWRLVVRVDGRVESLHPGQSDWSPIWRSRILSDGDRARTLQNSNARVKLADQSEFTIGPDTEVEMTRFSLTPESRTVLFNLKIGQIQASVAKALNRASRFEVTTPNGVLAARGTEFTVRQTADDTFLEVAHGRVDVTTARGHRTFRAGDAGAINRHGFIQFNPGAALPAAPPLTRVHRADPSPPHRARPVLFYTGHAAIRLDPKLPSVGTFKNVGGVESVGAVKPTDTAYPAAKPTDTAYPGAATRR